MYKCVNCGHIFEEGEQHHWHESRGEYWGSDCSEEVSGCPLCHGEYEEAFPCEICGSEHFENELKSGLCKECINDYKFDVDMCFNIGKKDSESIQLNCFLCSMFDVEEIEKILFLALKGIQKCARVDCAPFIDADRDWFAEKLKEEVKNNECETKKP